MRPRVLFVARTRYALPLTPTLQRRFEALSDVIDWRQFGTSATGEEIRNDRFTLVPPFPGRAPRRGRVLRCASGAAGPGDSRVPPRRDDRPGCRRHGARTSRSPARAGQRPCRLRRSRRLAEQHARLRLSRQTTALAGRGRPRAADASACRRGSHHLRLHEWPRPGSRRRAHRDVPGVHGPRHPSSALPPAPLPERPVALFVGVLERYKAVDVLAEAWRIVVAEQPDARLHIVGVGRLETIVQALVADPALGVSWTKRLDTDGVARALDASTLLVLPSRREGMGRVIVEAFCRGRAVVGTRSGGIPDLVEDGVNGVLVPPDDPDLARRRARTRSR